MKESIDWAVLRERSLLPGGFGADRVHIWPKLLNATPLEPDGENTSFESGIDQHHDERQIGLDTDRSFVLYPVETGQGQDRESLQRALHTLLIIIFRRHPKLSYFQGYHDIVTVFFLTLPPELQLPCAEQMSLQRLRDAMGTGLEPVVGQLYVLQNLLRLVDSDYAALLEEAAPIPYFALSNLLTLFSHDMPTLSLIRHVFDYLLCRPPIASVYLAASITLARKEEALRLQEENEEGMLHSLLSSLPEIYEEKSEMEGKLESLPKNSKQRATSNSEPELMVADSTTSQIKKEVLATDTASALQVIEMDSNNPVPSQVDVHKIESSQGSLGDDADIDEKVPFLAHVEEDPLSTLAEAFKSTSDQATPPLVTELNNVPLFFPPPEDAFPSSPQSRSSSPTRGGCRPHIPLSSLLSRADDLLRRFPPSTPQLATHKIFGANSVMHTWNEDPARMPADIDAEAMVEHPELVVLPYSETREIEDKEVEQEQKEKEREGRRRRRLRKRRRVVIERGVVLTTAIVVVGVAMAVYGGRTGGVRVEKHEWRRMGKWLGGAVLGVGERLWDGLKGL